jgi:hypothetical protein
MWNVNPAILCHKHLCGEHVEMHMFLGSIKKGISLNGYIRNKLVEVHNILKRHEELAREMKFRGFNHNSPLIINDIQLESKGIVDVESNIKELCGRCDVCRSNIGRFYGK